MRKLYLDNIRIIDDVELLCEAVAKQDYVRAMPLISQLTGKLSKAMQSVLQQADYFASADVTVSEAYIMEMLTALLEAQQAGDYILYADLMKLQIMPFFVDIQNAIRTQEGFFYDERLLNRNLEHLQNKDNVLYDAVRRADDLHGQSEYKNSIYKLEYTTIGAYTLAIEESGKTYYLHSNENPYREARQFSYAYFDIEQDRYFALGLGLGYHWAEFLKRNPDIRLTICEPDIGILQLAFAYMDMGWYLDSENVTIIYDPEYISLRKLTADHDAGVFVFLRPYLNHIKNEKIRHHLENIFVRDNNIRAFKHSFILNSRSNFQRCDGYVDELADAFKGKKVVILAAGPSLIKNVELLREKPADVLVLAVGTVYKKLAAMDILPDYVIMTDPKPEMMSQLQGVENRKIPLLLLSTAYKGLAETYLGKKYLICQRDYDRAECYAKEKGYGLYHTGGSVVTTALDVAIRMEAGAIIFAGLDLAFTDSKGHADGIYAENHVTFEDMIMVPDVDGGLVGTNRPMNMYREWIEKRLKQEDVIMPVYDATEGGALIAGTKIMKLQDVL